MATSNVLVQKKKVQKAIEVHGKIIRNGYVDMCFFVATSTKMFSSKHGGTWRIIPVSKWLVTPIYKPFRQFRPFGREITPVGGTY